MAGTLTKRIEQPVLVQGAKPGSPGYAGEPARPAYSYTVSEKVCRNVFIDRGPAPTRTGGVNGRLGYYAYICTMEDTIVNVPAYAGTPAIPPVPASSAVWQQSSGLGWTAGASSRDVLLGDGEYSFKVPAAAGATVGLTPDNTSTSPNEITHGFQLMSGLPIPIESGVVVGSYGTATPTTTYKIRRSLGVVSYFIGASLVRTSPVPSFGPVVLDASLYLGGDQVVYLGMTTSLDGEIRAVAAPAQARVGDAYSDITAVAARAIVSMTMPGFSELRAVAARPSVFAGSGTRTGEIHAVAPRPTAYMDSGLPAPDYSLMQAVTNRAQVAMIGLTGGVGSIEAVPNRFEAVMSEGSYGYCAVTASADHDAYLSEGSARAMMYEALVLAGDADAYRYMAVAFNSTGAILGELSASRVMTATMDDSMLAAFSVQLSSILKARFAETLSFGDNATGRRTHQDGARSEDEVTWAVNYDTGAYSEYSGYGFDAMYERDGLYFGTRGAQVYLLGGDDDDGTPIDAFVAFGKQNFGDTLLKHIPNVYAGVSSTGVLLLRVTTGTATYTYRARRNDETTRTQRFDLGRGLRGTYYEFELFNEDGADFELDSIEFAVVPTTRRI